MKITTFNPQILTEKPDQLIKLFEELGFKKEHSQEGVGAMNVGVIRMEDSNGFNLDISTPDIDLPEDKVAIRMNVDDFDEAFKLLKDHGFTNIYGTRTIETETGKSAVMLSPSGFAINLVQHLK